VANTTIPNTRANTTLQQVVDDIASQPLQFEPGSQWKYGHGLTVIGRVIEVVSGIPYEDFLARRIFQPLGMTDTTFRPSDDQAARLAVIYKLGADKKSLVPLHDDMKAMLALRRTQYPNPSGGLASTAPDLLRFYRMILHGGEHEGRRILWAESVKLMTTAITGDMKAGFVPGSAWALGWGTVKEPTGVTAALSPGTFGHGGAFGTQGWIDPKKQLITILLIQLSGIGNSDGSEIRNAFTDLAGSPAP
jgi:CubicO group peptidase (beta-lactamase class C family)